MMTPSAEFGADIARSGAVPHPHAEMSTAGVEDFVALMKPRVMSLVVFTALVGMVVAPGTLHPVLGFVGAALHRHRRGRVGRAQHVVRRRYRRGDDPDPKPADPCRPRQAGRSAGLWRDAGARFGGRARPCRQYSCRPRCWPFTIFFYAVIYTMWLKRSTPQNIVIGGAAGAFPPMIGWAAATGSISIESGRPVRHHLLLDAAALLGAGSAACRRIFPRRRADASGNVRPCRDAPADSHLLAAARAARCCALCARLCRPGVWRGRDRWRRGLPCAGAAPVPARRRAGIGCCSEGACSDIRSSTCSCCLR